MKINYIHFNKYKVINEMKGHNYKDKKHLGDDKMTFIYPWRCFCLIINDIFCNTVL